MLQFGKVINAEVFELNKRANDAENGIVDLCVTTTSDLTLMGILSNSSNCILTAISNGVLTTLNLQFTNDHSNKAVKVYMLGINPLRIGFLQKSSLLFVLNLASYFKNNKLPGSKVTPNNATKANSRLSGGGAKPAGFLNLEETLKTATAIINIKQYNYVFPSFISPLNSSNQHRINMGTSNELILCGYSDGTISLWDTGKKQDNCFPFDVISVNSAHTINSNGSMSSTSTNYSNIVHRIDMHSVTHVGFDSTRSEVGRSTDLIIITLHNQILIRTALLQSENIKSNHIASTTSNHNHHTFFVLQNRPDPNLYALYDGNSSDSGALRHLLIQTSPHHHTSVQYVASNAVAHRKLTRLLHVLSENKPDGPAELGGGRNVLSNVVSIYDSATLARMCASLDTAGDSNESVRSSDVSDKQSELVLSVDKHTQLLWLYAVPINCGSNSEDRLISNHNHNDTRTTTDHHDHSEQTNNEVPVFGFASVNLHTILNPTSNVSNGNVSNGTDIVRPRKDVILNVSLLDSFLVVVCGHAQRHDCCTVTIARLDDLSVSRVYQLPVKEVFLSVQHPDRKTHTSEGAGSSSTSCSSSSAGISSSGYSSSTIGNTEFFIATHHSVYCLREDRRVATIIKHTTAATAATTEQELNALGVGQVDMFYITQINLAQSAAKAGNHSEALGILSDLLKNRSVSPTQTAPQLNEAVKTGVTVEQASMDSSLLPVTGVFTSPRNKKKKQPSSAGVANGGITAAVASGSGTAADKTGLLCGGGRTLSHSLFKYLNTLCIEYLIDQQTSVEAGSTGSHDGANMKFFSLQTMLYESGNDCYFVNKVVARLLENNLEEEARKVLDRKHVSMLQIV